jgi:hypothetical protein
MSIIPPDPVNPGPPPLPPAPEPPKNLFEAAAQNCVSAFPVGFDFTIITQIITALVGIFQGCMKPPTPAAARQHVQESYLNGHYDHGTLRIATHQAMRAAHQAKTRISKEEATAVAIASLDQIRTSDDATIQAAMEGAS